MIDDLGKTLLVLSLQIYCDAAAINSYWLIAAGSCLARHHKTKTVAERSAYISYCSDKWWETESVAYVRRSLIHPSYSNRDKTRRHHYNIGIVKSSNKTLFSVTVYIADATPNK